MTEFEASLEEKIRPVVLRLRAEGLNTVSSCHHEGLVQIASCDPTNERRILWNVMYELGVKKWIATLEVTQDSRDFWEVRSEQFKVSMAAAGKGKISK